MSITLDTTAIGCSMLSSDAVTTARQIIEQVKANLARLDDAIGQPPLALSLQTSHPQRAPEQPRVRRH